MSSRQEAPEPWASAMRDRGFVHHDKPSMTRLARESGVGVQTVINAILGRSQPDVETLDALATALRVDPRDVASWVGVQRVERRPWNPPAEADLLTAKEQRALDALIRAIAERAGGSRGDTSPMNDEVTVSGQAHPDGTLEGEVEVEVEHERTRKPRGVRRSP